MWRRGLGVALSLGMIGCGEGAEAPSEIVSETPPPPVVSEPSGKPQESVPKDRAALDAESIEAAPPGAPRAIAVRLAPRQWQRLGEYASLLGRASACGIDLSDEALLVDRWMNKLVPPDVEGHAAFKRHTARQMAHMAEAQASGDIGSCEDVQGRADRMVWP